MTSDQMARIQGQTAFDNTGQKVGDVQRVFLDRDTNEPTWITVRAGRLGGQETVVPLAGARLGPNGLSLAVRKDAINDAPAVDVGSELDMDVITKLNRYYDRSTTGTQPAPRPDVGIAEEPRGHGYGDEGTAPVETVRLAPETRVDQQRVNDQVRRERIEVDDQRVGAARPDQRR